MSFELPNLDRKSYQKLLAEMIRRIPQYTRQWTNYNDSDPGITLLQLLAWLDESLLYQANAIPLATQENYLRWVLGLALSDNTTAYASAAVTDNDFAFLDLQQVLAALEQGPPLSKASLQQHVLHYIAQPYMALSLSSVEQLAMQTNLYIAQQAAAGAATPLLVRRVHARDAEFASTAYILSNAKAQYQYPPYPNPTPAAGSTSLRKCLMFVAGDGAAESVLLTQVGTFLAPRVIAGSRVAVRTVQYTDINLALEVVCAPNTRLDLTLALLFGRLFTFFLPCEGGADGKGWPYGDAPAEAAIGEFVLAAEGIDRIARMDFNFIPTMQLGIMATLGVNAQLADLPGGAPGMFYQGLPRLRCLDVTARSQA
ncbi:hypothetical protein ACO0LM_01460 [Undibacterium sp. Di26W]|uniref:hypothetical protein n=1 Tax=Undibacterium sp. Di26W TaxID=3413035 RepID=UPI003BF1F444